MNNYYQFVGATSIYSQQTDLHLWEYSYNEETEESQWCHLPLNTAISQNLNLWLYAADLEAGGDLLDLNDHGWILAQAQAKNPATGELVEDKSKLVLLIPVEAAPEVLAVNSDFDEGRINKKTGYAIPDCDDDEIALQAEKNHLDGDWKKDELVIDDLYEGFFGMHPHKNVPEGFFDGAEIKIEKLDKIDDDTGHPESGQIRFYAIWGEGENEQYCAITPYDLKTLTAVDLAKEGINNQPNEPVYGKNSKIPEDAKFYLEGVRPGKITLKWSYKKGNAEFEYEQSFLVATQKSNNDWFDGVRYHVRLQTIDDPSSEINIKAVPSSDSANYKANVERASEYYDYYEQLFNKSEGFSWAGLARLVGGQVIAGVSDAQHGIDTFDFLQRFFSGMNHDELKELQYQFFLGGRDIFRDVGWQHRAFDASGIEALEYVLENEQDEGLDFTMIGWQNIKKGIEENNSDLIADGARRIADYEQNQVIVRRWDRINEIGNGSVIKILSDEAVSPLENAVNFREFSPTGSIGDTNNRWQWVISESPLGMLKAWNELNESAKENLVNENLKTAARKFSHAWENTTSGLTLIFPNKDILVWDYQDQPGEQ